MSEYSPVLLAVFPILAVILIGAFMRHVGWLTLEADRSLMRITINLLVPCLIFEAILGNQALENWKNLFLAPLVGFVTICLGFTIAHWSGALMKLHTPRERRTFSFTVGTYNYGYIPLPLTLALFDRNTLGVLFLHNVGVEIAIWTIGLALLTGASVKQGWKNFLNPPLFAILLALFLNYAGIRQHIPEFMMGTVHMIGQCAVPLGLLLIGATTLDFASETRPFEGKQILFSSCLLRLLVIPLLFIAIARWLPCSIELKRIIVLQSAMPSAVFPIVMAKHYGGDVRTALRIVLGTSLISLGTIPLWIHFGLNLILDPLLF